MWIERRIYKGRPGYFPGKQIARDAPQRDFVMTAYQTCDTAVT